MQKRNSSGQYCTLAFKDPEIEEAYQSKRISLGNFPCIGKVFFWSIVFLGIGRRLQMLYDSYYGSRMYDASGELRLTISYIAGQLVELIIGLIPKFKSIRGFVFIATFFWQIVDASLFYYPNDFALVPSSFVMIFMCFLVSIIYSYNWIISMIACLISVTINSTYLLTTFSSRMIETLMYAGQWVQTATFLVLLCYFFEKNSREAFYSQEQIKKSQFSLDQLLQNTAEGVIMMEGREIVFVNQSMKKMLAEIDPSYLSKITNLSSVAEGLTLFVSHFKEKAKEIISEETSNPLITVLFKEQSEETKIEIPEKYIYVHKAETKKKSYYYEFHKIHINYGGSQRIAFVIQEKTSFKELLHKEEAEKYQKCLIASVTHDLRTPLNGILGITSGLEAFVSVEGKSMITLIKNTGSMMLYLINDVLDFAQIEAKKLKLHPEAQPLFELANEVIELMKFNYKQKNINLRFELAPVCPLDVITDGKRYKQILLNLLGNALKFTTRGGVDVFISYDREIDKLITRVQDSGIGIKKEDVPHLFKLFGRIKSSEEINTSGVGLGLHICKMLTELLGGDIFVDTEYELGSSFIFYISQDLIHPVNQRSISPEYIITAIKRSQEEEKSISQSSANIEAMNEDHKSPLEYSSHRMLMPKPDSRKKECECSKVLIVEDNEMNIYVCKTFLLSINTPADFACNGKEAIDAVMKKAKTACCRRYDIIFMDICMPIMDGIEATKRIKELIQQKIVEDSPIIGLSANCFDENNSLTVVSTGFEKLMEKPITKEEFIKTVAAYLHLPL